MELLSTDRRYAKWTVTSSTALGSPPQIGLRKIGATAWTWVSASWAGADQLNANGMHVRSCSVLLSGPEAAGGGSTNLSVGNYETAVKYTDSSEIISVETEGISVKDLGY